MYFLLIYSNLRDLPCIIGEISLYLGLSSFKHNVTTVDEFCIKTFLLEGWRKVVSMTSEHTSSSKNSCVLCNDFLFTIQIKPNVFQAAPSLRTEFYFDSNFLFTITFSFHEANENFTSAFSTWLAEVWVANGGVRGVSKICSDQYRGNQGNWPFLRPTKKLRFASFKELTVIGSVVVKHYQ